MGNNAVRTLRGLRVVAEALRAEDFPTTKSDLDYSVGDVEIENGHGNYIPVREVLTSIDQDDFSSPEEAVRAIRAAVHKARLPKAS